MFTFSVSDITWVVHGKYWARRIEFGDIKHQYLVELFMDMSLFISIIVFCGTNMIQQNIPQYSPIQNERGE